MSSAEEVTWSWQSFHQHHMVGKMRPLVRDRETLDRLVMKEWNLNAHDTIYGRALLSMLHCMMLDLPAAIAALAPYVAAVDGKVKLDDDAIGRQSSPFISGLVYSQAANICYRTNQTVAGLRASSRARRLLRTAARNGSWEGRQIQLALWENELWTARLRVRRNEPAAALKLIRKLVDKLNDTLDRTTRKLPGDMPSSPAGGAYARVHLLLAMTLDLWALIDWRQGRLDEARRRIYRGLFLLTSGSVDDPVRRAQLLFSASRIEASHSENNAGTVPWARHLAGCAARAFEEVRHPFHVRALLKEAICYLKSNEVEASGQHLEYVSRLVDKDAFDLGKSAWNHALTLGELRLTRLFHLEAKANVAEVSWEDVRSAAAELHRLPLLPARLKAEARLHEAIATIRLGERGALDEADGLLDEALSFAKDAHHLKIEAACYLARVELAQTLGDTELLRKSWSEASEAVTRSQSSYLEAWALSLSVRLQEALPVKFDKTWPAFVPYIRRLYKGYWAQYGARNNLNQEQVRELVKVGRTMWYEGFEMAGERKPREMKRKRGLRARDEASKEA